MCNRRLRYEEKLSRGGEIYDGKKSLSVKYILSFPPFFLPDTYRQLRFRSDDKLVESSKDSFPRKDTYMRHIYNRDSHESKGSRTEKFREFRQSWRLPRHYAGSICIPAALESRLRNVSNILRYRGKLEILDGRVKCYT